MKLFNELIYWGTLYILVGLFIGGLIWEENLYISPGAHKIFAVGLLVCFGFFVSRWIATHQTNFLVDRNYDNQSTTKKDGA